MPSELYPCPCCGYFMFPESPGSFDICNICVWQDCHVQLTCPFDDSGPNRTSLYDSQRNFLRNGPSEERLRRSECRLADFTLDPTWRPFDPAKDAYLRWDVPEDRELVPNYSFDGGRYYWRDDYWLRSKGSKA